MDKNINDLFKEIAKINKEIKQLDSHKDILEIKKTLKNMDRQINEIMLKVQEFEIIMDAAELLEEHMEDEAEKYNTEWNPYEEEGYEPEDYEQYDDEDDEEI